MGDENFLCPDLAKDTTKRYAARNDNRPWTDMETRFMFHVLMACGTENAFNRAMQTVSRILERSKAFPADSHPTPTEEAQGLFNIFQARRHKLLGGHKGEPIPRNMGDVGMRAGLPLTYSEKKFFLKTHHKASLKLMPNPGDYVTPHVTSVCIALARNPGDALVRQYLARCKEEGLGFRDREDYDAPKPHEKEAQLTDWWDDYGEARPYDRSPFEALLGILEVI